MIGRFCSSPAGRVIVRFSIQYQSVKKRLDPYFKNHPLHYLKWIQNPTKKGKRSKMNLFLSNNNDFIYFLD